MSVGAETMPRLSIIIPCYNCERTLEEAVESIYCWEPATPFDVIMVDDGSTDGTYKVMQGLAARHREIGLVRHSSNRGGGAARNTGVANSHGDLVFCLDSDDMLGPDFLRNMVRFWVDKRCDGVGMSTSIKFKGSSIHDVAYKTEYEGPGQRVRFESFLAGPLCSLGVVFLMTREAFLRTGGYPTDHGFDTQGMAFRFLSEGLVAYTCPNAVYYHRVDFHESYYLREQSAGRINWNWFNVLNEHLYVFKKAIQEAILGSDLFEVPGRPKPAPLLDVVYGRDNIYASNYRQLIRLGREGVARRFEASDDKLERYWVGRHHRARAEYKKAISHFTRAIELGFDHQIIHLEMLAASLGLSGHPSSVSEGLKELVLYSQPYPIPLLPLTQRLFRYAMGSKFLHDPATFLKRIWDRLKRRRS